ncbi:MAG: thiolase family protein [Spirochaeta sp.]|nr:thiolase family protein [Spirochaeta sp.]
MKERLAIVDGIRSPLAKAGGELKDISADDLGAFVTKHIVARNSVDPHEIDEVIFGNVAQPADAANVARVIALKAGLPRNIPAYTVHRNCASGMESISTAANKIFAGEASIILAGGTESMSNIPLLFNREYTSFVSRMMRAKSPLQKARIFMSFRPRFLRPIIGVQQGLTDPVSGMIMGDTAEVLAREFKISRESQDEYALLSHQRAVAAAEQGMLADEIIPIPVGEYKNLLKQDSGPRPDQSAEALAKLKPYFDRHNGTVTVGNACPLTDGAAAVLLMSEKEAKRRKLQPLGYLREYAYASLEPERMGLGPVYATSKLLQKTKTNMSDFEVIELNEAFAAQVIANEIAFDSDAFAKQYLERDSKLGFLDREILNPQGGAIALGHPVGTTGTRITIHVLRELRRTGKNTGLATLCVGGGQGAAFLLEVE